MPITTSTQSLLSPSVPSRRAPTSVVTTSLVTSNFEFAGAPMPPFHVDIHKTDRSYKERLALASAMASNISKGLASSISRGLSPATSLIVSMERNREPQLHLIMLVGLVASGKTTLARSIVEAFGGYILVSGGWVEEEGKWEEEWDKCVFAARTAFESGMNVISDLTNETARKRRKWITLAGEYGASIDAIVLDTSISTCHQRITNIYTNLRNDERIQALEKAIAYHNRLQRIALQYTKPASAEFSGRVIYLPEGVQSSGYWSAEKLRRFLPDMVSQALRKIFNSSTQGFESEEVTHDPAESVQDDDAPAASARTGNMQTGTSAESFTSMNYTGQLTKTKRYGSLSSNLSALPLLDTSSQTPQRRCSPNAVAIRASPRRRKRTHERRLTVAIKVADLAAKTSPPSFIETKGSMGGDSTDGLGNENTMNELILECPTSPLRTRTGTLEEVDSREAFVGIIDHGNNPSQTFKKVSTNSSSIPIPTLPSKSPGARVESPFIQTYQNNVSMPSSVQKEAHKGFGIATEPSPLAQTPPFNKFADDTESNCMWKKTENLGSLGSFPSSTKERDYLTLGSSPTTLGFASNFIQNTSRQKREDVTTTRGTTISQLAAQFDAVKSNEYDGFSAQFNSKNRLPIHGLDGCSLNDSVFLDAFETGGFLKNDLNAISEHSIVKSLPTQKHEFAYSTSIQLEQSVHESYDSDKDGQ